MLPIPRRSHEWGVQPWHWYLTSALPRALHAGYPLALAAPLLDRRARPLLFVAAGFVALYSKLPHKEVRFLFPVLPLWNLAAALTLARLWAGRRKSAARALLAAAAAAAVAAGLGVTALTAAASAANYPGGAALAQLHSLGAADAAAAAAAGHRLTVHIDILPAMTGVSRFGEEGAPWAYSKDEGLAPAQLAERRFDFLLTGDAAVPGYRQVAAVHGFQRLALAARSPGGLLRAVLAGQPPVQVVTAPQVYIQRRDAAAAAAAEGTAQAATAAE